MSKINSSDRMRVRSRVRPSKGIKFSKRANMWLEYEHFNQAGKTDVVKWISK